MMSSECPLCQKLANLDSLPPEDVVWQFPHSIALLGPWQFYEGYCILVARRHAREFSDLDNAERHAYFDEMCLLARAIDVTFRPLKMNYEVLGNQVPHLHWHLFPRSVDDPETLQAVWLALDRAGRDASEKQRLTTGSLDRVATSAALRESLRQLTSAVSSS